MPIWILTALSPQELMPSEQPPRLKEGKGGGEFYTPSCVVRTLVEVLRPFNNCRVYEKPCQL